ncbi:MAG: NUMOD4 domain-containing protein [Cyclobacteriaceae bacterium]|tara:strand:- start:9969 stop:10460 length:492 start_codon:yes stop_codon:yes gene_type:complete
MADQSEEKWEGIKGFSNYEISNKGRIRSKTRKSWHKGSQVYMKIKGKLMKQRWNKTCKCYFLDLIDDEKKRRTVYPHKETAIAFVENPDPSTLTMIIHEDNNPRNNKADNLKWVSASDHMKWQFEVGNKNNYKVWKTRKKRYKNGFKPGTVLPGRPKKNKTEA